MKLLLLASHVFCLFALAVHHRSVNAKIAMLTFVLFDFKIQKVEGASAQAPFNWPFKPCGWSCQKCSASSGIHHMKSCDSRPDDFHIQVGYSRVSF
jgi:hypothetical protein